ncbi:hypothetical protein [Salmonella phage vB_SenAt-pSL2]|uniref:Uncharacterized protein n=2 Tax=Zindervirus TaxID=542837 RepID=A0A9E7LBU3_9CAUD|nr:hypothetical protein I132_gp18 [Escherichia phage UAB_Phi78]ADW95222.1 hypothetical protein UAB78_018 [Escherichia phage UAB_Phi78]QZQ75065.1 hypothetical protein [Salmonella phage vB_SenAt-pSL2]URG17651.1 hypothetical protein GRN51_350 [Salmonella phage GRNsp51]WCZ56812.1 hypothetical protein K30_018 [Salmonella phage Kenya-K30]
MINYDSDWDYEDSLQPEPETPDYKFETEAMYEDY